MDSATYIIEEDELLCPLCLSVCLDRDPRILSCLHVYCYDCVKRLAMKNSKISCPVCKYEETVPNEDYHQLKKFFLTKSIKQINIKVCSKHGKELSLYCKYHNLESICSECFENEHLNCQITTMNRKVNSENLIANVKEVIETEKSRIGMEIDFEESKIMSNFEMINEKIEHIFNNIRSEIEENLNCKTVDEKLIGNIIEFLEGVGKIAKPHIQASYTSINTSKMLQTMEQLVQFASCGGNSKFYNVKDLFTFYNLDFTEIQSKMTQIINSRINDDPQYFTPTFLVVFENKNLSTLNAYFIEKSDLTNSNFLDIIKIFVTFQCSKIISIKRYLNGKNYWSNFFTTLQYSADKLTDISIVSCNLNENDGENLGQLFKMCQRLIKVNISGNINLKNGFKSICDGLKESRDTLRCIDFSLCNLTEMQGACIEHLFQYTLHIENVNLYSNRNTGRSLCKIIENLKRSRLTLKIINLSDCDLDTNQCKKLSELLELCSGKLTINLNDNNFMNNGLLKIFDSLKSSNKTGSIIDLKNVDLTQQQCFELSKLLNYGLDIQSLYPGKNTWIDNGLSSIFLGLVESNGFVKEIDLSALDVCDSHGPINVLSIPGIELIKIDNLLPSFCKCLMNSTKTLRVISFYFSSDISENQLECIENLLGQCCNIQELHLDWKTDSQTNYSFNFYDSLMASRDSLRKFSFGVLLDDDSCRNLGNLLMKCSKLESISFKIDKNVSDGLKAISFGLMNSIHSLRELNFEHEFYCDFFIDFLKKCSKLEKINMKWNDNLIDSLISSSLSLKEIKFSGFLSDRNVEKLFLFLMTCKNIEIISLPWIESKSNEFYFLLEGLKNSSSSLQGIKFHILEMENSQIQLLKDLMENNLKIKQNPINVYLHVKNPFKNEFGELYKSGKSLTVIDLSYSDIQGYQCKKFGELLSIFNQIEIIDLTGNMNMGQGLKSITEGLKASFHTLKKIYFRRIGLTEDSSFYVGDLLKVCLNLDTLSLAGNDNIQNGLSFILNSLTKSSEKLRELDLSNCKINELSQENLSKLLTECNVIRKIDLSNNTFNVEHFANVCQSLTVSRLSLSYLLLDYCQLNENQITELGKLLLKCSFIRKLSLVDNLISKVFPSLYNGLKNSKEFLIDIDVRLCNITAKQRSKFRELCNNSI